MPTWVMGTVQPGNPHHDAGLRRFVTAAGSVQNRPIAWTETDEAAKMIIEALEKLPN